MATFVSHREAMGSTPQVAQIHEHARAFRRASIQGQAKRVRYRSGLQVRLDWTRLNRRRRRQEQQHQHDRFSWPRLRSRRSNRVHIELVALQHGSACLQAIGHARHSTRCQKEKEYLRSGQQDQFVRSTDIYSKRYIYIIFFFFCFV